MTAHNRLDEMLTQTQKEGRAALIPYVTAGFPKQESFVDLAVHLLESGADALEIGIPFSDPLLDGPSIQQSQQAALEEGVTTASCLEYAVQIRRRSDRPVLFMGAYNPVVAFGVERFCREAGRAGVTGLIVPDVPIEEQGDLHAACRANKLHLIQLVAPTSTNQRVHRVCSAASGFVYCISVAGVTGTRTNVVSTARPLVERVRRCTDVPVAVGFGIAGPDQAREVGSFADAVIVGSAVINTLAEAPQGEKAERTGAFLTSLRQALDPSGVA